MLALSPVGGSRRLGSTHRWESARQDAFPTDAGSGIPRTAAPDSDSEASLRYVLRPPIARERLEQRHDGFARINLKKAYTGREAALGA